MRAGAEERLGGFHERLRQRRVRVDSEAQVVEACAHLDGERRFAHELPGAASHDPDAEDALRARLDDELRDAAIAREGRAMAAFLDPDAAPVDVRFARLT